MFKSAVLCSLEMESGFGDDLRMKNMFLRSVHVLITHVRFVEGMGSSV